MQGETMAIILLAVASIGLSQLPYPQGNPEPVTNPASQSPSFTATRTVIYWDSFPIVWFGTLGLYLIAQRYAGELKHAQRLDETEAEEELRLAAA